MKTLLSLGHGYSAAALAQRLLPLGWRVLGTTRSPEKAAQIADTGVEPVLWEKTPLVRALSDASHVLASAAPGSSGDPALALIGREISEAAGRLDWVGYLSTTGVYGDHKGDWVTEDTPLAPATARGHARAAAERAWSDLGLPLHIFRLAGIYGPGRGPFAKVRAGTARRIIKPGQVFSRIHVDDIAQVLHASIKAPCPGRIYNVCDNDPAPPQDVIAEAARLLGMPVPAAVDFDTVELSPMARSFYSESKRVSNARIRDELGVNLLYPDYRTGLRAVLAAETI